MASHLTFVGSFAGPDQPGVHALAFDDCSGALTPLAVQGGIANPAFLAVNPTKPCLYAVSEVDGGSVSAFRFNMDGSLEPINCQPSGGDAPCHLAMDADGAWLIVSNYSSGSVRLMPIESDGALGEPTHSVQHHGRGTDDRRQAKPHAHSATFSPDGRFVLVADLGIDQIAIYALDADAGKLGAHGSVPVQPGAGPRHLAFHPRGDRLYAANELNNTISAYTYDPMNITLREEQPLTTLPPGAPQSLVADLHVSPDGRRAYVSNRGHDSIATFDIAADGDLSPGPIASCGGCWPRHFNLAPGGEFLLVANQRSGEIAVLPLGSTLGNAIAKAAVPGASCVQFSGVIVDEPARRRA